MRSDGRRSRTAILEAAGQLATVEGIEGLSIGRLAREVGISKSGVYAHFGSKEELQLATIESARDLFDELVLDPADRAGRGLDRLWALVDHYLRYVGEGTYPGGCFFASIVVELGAQPGPVRDAALAVSLEYLAQLTAAAAEAQADGEIVSTEDSEQLGFEVDAFLFLANSHFVVSGDSAVLDRARHAVEQRVARALP